MWINMNTSLGIISIKVWFPFKKKTYQVWHSKRNKAWMILQASSALNPKPLNQAISTQTMCGHHWVWNLNKDFNKWTTRFWWRKNLKDSCFHYGKKFPQNITTYAINIIEGHETWTKIANPKKNHVCFN